MPRSVGFADLPLDVLREISSWLDPVSSLCLALTHKLAFEDHDRCGRDFLCGKRFLYACCEFGHLDILKSATDPLDFGPNEFVPGPRALARRTLRASHAARAAFGGHHNILEFLKKRFGIPFDSEVVYFAALGGHVETLAFFAAEAVPFRKLAYFALGKSGNLECIKWAYKNFDFLSQSQSNLLRLECEIGALVSGHIGVIDLLETLTPSRNPLVRFAYYRGFRTVCLDALTQNRFNVFEWAYWKVDKAERSGTFLSDIISTGCRSLVFPALFGFLRAHVPDLDLAKILQYAIDEGHLTVIKEIKNLKGDAFIRENAKQWARIISLRQVAIARFLISCGAEPDPKSAQRALERKLMPFIELFKPFLGKLPDNHDFFTTPPPSLHEQLSPETFKEIDIFLCELGSDPSLHFREFRVWKMVVKWAVTQYIHHVPSYFVDAYFLNLTLEQRKYYYLMVPTMLQSLPIVAGSLRDIFLGGFSELAILADEAGDEKSSGRFKNSNTELKY